MTIRTLGSFGMVLGLLLAAGCGSEPEANPSKQKYRDGGSSSIQGDAVTFSNTWSSSANPEAGAPAGGSDAKVITGNCQGPTGATCASACSADSICTAAKSGTCAKTVVLKGAANSKEVLAAMASAFVSCWNNPAPSYGNKLCYGFDACQLSGTYDINDESSPLHTWVCSKAVAADFSSKADYDTAKDIFACGGLFPIPRPRFFANISSGTTGKVCLWYKNAQWSEDTVEMNDCAKL
jgi:hypothetical protein